MTACKPIFIHVCNSFTVSSTASSIIRWIMKPILYYHDIFYLFLQASPLGVIKPGEKFTYSAEVRMMYVKTWNEFRDGFGPFKDFHRMVQIHL